MSRALLILDGPHAKSRAEHWIRLAELGTRVEFKRPQRTLDQNAKMWATLTDIAGQVTWVDGQKYTPDDWKDYFLHALRKGRWMPDEAGGYVPIGMRSSDLSKDEMSELIELILEFAARYDVKLSNAEPDPNVDAPSPEEINA
jgi:hypothetical protein